MNRNRYLILAIAFLILGCTSKNQITVLLYNDFGPQAMAYETLGNNWWSWLDCMCDGENDKYPVKIIVYAGQNPDAVKKQYPVDKNAGLDYRYIKYCDAMRYLDNNINDLSDAEELSELRQRLINTKVNLLTNFADLNCEA